MFLAILGFCDIDCSNQNGIQHELKHGITSSELADYDSAVARFSEAIRRKSDDVGAYSNRGVVHVKQGRLDNAIGDFSEVIRLRPNLAGAYSNRGIAYGKKGELDKAYTDFKRAHQLDPSIPAHPGYYASQEPSSNNDKGR